MGVGLLLFPQMYEQMMDRNDERKVMAVCPHCGTLNEHPYKFCRECGKRPDAQKERHADGMFKVCPYCGLTLDLPKRPNFCPYCAERLQ